MQNEIVCDRICEDIASLLVHARARSRQTAFAAAHATRDLSAALHHAAGNPADPLWYEALWSLDLFLERSFGPATLEAARACERLRNFLTENADLLERPTALLAS
jgi:hypothetical protein